MASLRNFVFFCISAEVAGCKRPHGLKGSLVSIKVSVNLTFDLPAALFTHQVAALETSHQQVASSAFVLL